MNGVDSHHAAIRVHQRPAAVAGIDGRVGLDIDHGVVRLDLPPHRTHHAHADRVLQPQRISEGHDNLPLAQGIGIAQSEVREAGLLDFHHRQIRVAIHTYDPRVQHFPGRLQGGVAGLSTASRTRTRCAFATTWLLVTM